MSRTLIFGGAFDPPHCEHVAICRAAMKELGADKLALVPTYKPPHKDGGFLSFEERRSLVCKAFADFDFVIDDLERERGEDNCSYKVLPILKERYGDIVYLIGGDSVAHFESWKKPEEVVRICPIAVAAREGYGDVACGIKALQNKYGGDFTLISYEGKDISSSLLKARLLLGEDVSELPSDVLKEIRNRGLFEEYGPWIEKLKEYQSEELFEHSKSVVKRAVQLNSKHNLGQDFVGVFTAALLHDNAKQRPSTDGLPVPENSLNTPVLHQFLGAEKAKRDFGVTDEQVLSAIRYHTTAKADMSTLEKLIYTADSVSDDREYEPIPRLREIAVNDFEEGFLAVLAYTYGKLTARGGGIYPLTREAYDFYINKVRE